MVLPLLEKYLIKYQLWSSTKDGQEPIDPFYVRLEDGSLYEVSQLMDRIQGKPLDARVSPDGIQLILH